MSVGREREEKERTGGGRRFELLMGLYIRLLWSLFLLPRFLGFLAEGPCLCRGCVVSCSFVVNVLLRIFLIVFRILVLGDRYRYRVE